MRVGQTEVIKDCLNPKFSTPIVVDYYFQELQELRFTIIDIDSHNKFDLLGTVQCVYPSLLLLITPLPCIVILTYCRHTGTGRRCSR